MKLEFREQMPQHYRNAPKLNVTLEIPYLTSGSSQDGRLVFWLREFDSFCAFIASHMHQAGYREYNYDG